jgi:hypothetical protein
VGSDALLELLIDQPIFIGFKVDSTLRRHFESLSNPDRQYISGDDSTFLRFCRAGEDIYVGKLIHDKMTTDRIDDICRNVLSIIRKLGHTVRLPASLRILACGGEDTGSLSAAVQIAPPIPAPPVAVPGAAAC